MRAARHRTISASSTATWQQVVQANMLIPVELIRASITDMA